MAGLEINRATAGVQSTQAGKIEGNKDAGKTLTGFNATEVSGAAVAAANVVETGKPILTGASGAAPAPVLNKEAGQQIVLGKAEAPAKLAATDPADPAASAAKLDPSAVKAGEVPAEE